MSLSEDIIIYGAVTAASKIYKSIKGITEVQCPYCFRKYNLKDGYYFCDCGNYFRKIGKTIYKGEKVPLPLYEYVSTLFNLVSKSNGIISSEMNNYIYNILNDEFKLNKDQIDWIYNSQQSLIHCNSYYTILNKIKEECSILKEPQEFCKLLLKEVMILSNLNRSNSEYNDKLIREFIDKFNIGLEDYLKLKSDLDGEFYENIYREDKSQIEKYYNILGITSNANKKEIKLAYKNKIKLYHPDRYSSYDLYEELKEDINEKMKEINLAYEYLMKLK